MDEKLKADLEARREIKDTVFSLMFSDNPAAAVSVSNTFLGTAYPPDTKVELKTLVRPLTEGRINDLAFVLDNRLVVLIEHQSTINENMPYRMLQYIAEMYKQLCKEEDEYRNPKFMLQRPKFIVFYNGTEKMADGVRILRLSDMFPKYTPEENSADDGLIDLELTVKMYNINRGCNENIIKNCATIHEYSIFMGMAREYQQVKKMSPEEAVQQAVVDCINQNVLKEFLLKHKWEVVNMLVSEWKLDIALKVREEEGAMKERIEMAKKMKKRGDSVQSIEEITGLTIDDILRL